MSKEFGYEILFSQYVMINGRRINRKRLDLLKIEKMYYNYTQKIRRYSEKSFRTLLNFKKRGPLLFTVDREHIYVAEISKTSYSYGGSDLRGHKYCPEFFNLHDKHRKRCMQYGKIISIYEDIIYYLLSDQLKDEYTVFKLNSRYYLFKDRFLGPVCVK